MVNIFISYVILYALLEWIYLRLAKKNGIIDKYNERSSHAININPIRGAGIIFPIAFILPFFLKNISSQNVGVLIAVLLISIISFLDDIKSVKASWRILIHFIAVGLGLWQMGMYHTNILYCIIAFVIIVGAINTYNFMDGINGITAVYSFVSVCSLFFINQKIISITDTSIFISLISSLLVFSFLNVRKITKCFSGDVGSISIAFIITFFICKLIYTTGNPFWILLLGVYGIDSIATILLRVIRKENLLVAHRSHFYQFLANERKLPHVFISLLYGCIQFIINILLITNMLVFSFILIGIVFSIYIIARLLLEGPKRLFISYY